jgi:integrase/recombinase XerD
LRRFQAAVGKPLAPHTLSDLLKDKDKERPLAGDGTGRKPPAAPTVNLALLAVKSLLSFAHETGYLRYNVGAAVHSLPEPDELAQRILTPEEVWSLIDHAPAGRDRVLLEVLYTCGVRRAEAAGLRWCDLQPRPEAGQVTVFGKGGKSRAVLVPAALWSDLLELRGGASSDEPVFASRRRALVGTESALKRRVARPLDLSMINLIVARAARAAGLGKKVSPHWMRHAHASQALDNGTPLHVLQATLGHSSLTTTSRYVHVRPDDSSSLYLPQRPEH